MVRILAPNLGQLIVARGIHRTGGALLVCNDLALFGAILPVGRYATN